MKRLLWLGLAAVALAVFVPSVLAQSIPTADEIIARMRANATAVEDLDAHLTVQVYDDGAVKLTQTLRLSLLQPDKMRQEYLAPEYLAGNLSLIVGDAMWIYIAANGTWYSKDLSTLSEAEQPWVGFRQLLRHVQDELWNYTFKILDVDRGVYHLHGVGASADAVYGAIELWVDPETYVPQRRLLYDTDGNLLVDVRILDVEAVSEGAYVARRLETYNEAGVLENTIVYDSVLVNQGLDPDLFALPEGASS